MRKNTKRLMNDEKALLIAKEIADDLFTNGAGVEADRLILVKEDSTRPVHDLGGWGKQFVIDRIVAILTPDGKERQRGKQNDWRS